MSPTLFPLMNANVRSAVTRQRLLRHRSTLSKTKSWGFWEKVWNFYAEAKLSRSSFSLKIISAFFSDYFFLSFCIWRNLVAGLRGRTSRRSRLVFATPKGCRPRYLVDTSIKIKRVSGPTHFQRRIYMLFVFYHRQEIVI